VLLLAALLPWRAYAMHCEPDAGGSLAQSPVAAPAAHAHAHCLEAHVHRPGGPGDTHSHACGDCCSAVAALPAVALVTLPPAPPTVAAGRLLWPAPARTSDRLDRPPR
jgi:hypothetical protein